MEVYSRDCLDRLDALVEQNYDIAALVARKIMPCFEPDFYKLMVALPLTVNAIGFVNKLFSEDLLPPEVLLKYLQNSVLGIPAVEFNDRPMMVRLVATFIQRVLERGVDLKPLMGELRTFC